MTPSVTRRIGLTDSAVPSSADAAPTQQKVVDQGVGRPRIESDDLAGSPKIRDVANAAPIEHRERPRRLSRNCGVIERRKQKYEARLAQAFDGEFRREIDGHTQSFEHVGGSAARRDGAIAVLGHLCSRGGGHEGGSAGDVER